jgi:hypothetical protein
MRTIVTAPGVMLRGVMRAVRARPLLFILVALGMFAVHVLLPPALLSVAKKPCDYFTFNAWLGGLPSYLSTDPAPLGVKLGKLWNLALFWFSSSNPYGTEWGFAVDTGDLVRMMFASLVIAAYVVLWRHRRVRFAHGPASADARAGVASVPEVRWTGSGARVGFVGALASAFGLTSGPCSVMGCGAPVIPVVGLAFSGLSSTTLTFLKDFSTWSTAVVLIGMTMAVAWLGWTVGAERPAR